GDRAPQGQYRQRRVGTNFGSRLRVLASGGSFGVSNTTYPKGPVDQGGQRVSVNVSRRSQANSIGRLNIVLAGRQRCAFDSIAEENVGSPVRLVHAREN